MTKWIHLQSLNAGLLTFFKKCHDKLNPGGRLVLEPQPFSTYQRSVKMSTRGQGGGNPSSSLLRDNFESLKSGAQRGWRWEEGDFERVLIELVGFEKCELLGETGKVGEHAHLVVVGPCVKTDRRASASLIAGKDRRSADPSRSTRNAAALQASNRRLRPHLMHERTSCYISVVY